jgi:hypothetical protein
MTQSNDSGLNLDHLEALAKAATPGPWHWVNPGNDQPRKLGEWRASLRTVQQFNTHRGDTLPKFIVDAEEIRDENMDANANFIAAANPAAVLALIQLARRAQPEGEAPQADDTVIARLADIHSELLKAYKAGALLAGGNGIDAGAYDHAKKAITEWDLPDAPAATLSPLCGAQHAQSGNESDPVRDALDMLLADYDVQQVITSSQLAQCRAAQQAAAPGTLNAKYAKVLRDLLLDVECGVLDGDARRDARELLDSEEDSAPGTPEAPKPPFPISDDEMAALLRFWECATDGEGYDVEQAMMQRLAEMGLVQHKSGTYYMATEFGLYLLGEYTIDRAAQLDGGQEGSDRG